MGKICISIFVSGFMDRANDFDIFILWPLTTLNWVKCTFSKMTWTHVHGIAGNSKQPIIILPGWIVKLHAPNKLLSVWQNLHAKCYYYFLSETIAAFYDYKYNVVFTLKWPGWSKNKCPYITSYTSQNMLTDKNMAYIQCLYTNKSYVASIFTTL